MRTPLHVVQGWPHWELRLYSAWFGIEPAPEERLEYALAHLASIQLNSNRAPSSAPTTLMEQMLFRNTWDPPAERDESDLFAYIDQKA